MAFKKKSAWFWVLIVSMALNLFFIGAIGARILNRPQMPPSPPSLGWILRDLEPAVRESLEPQMEVYGETLRPLRGQMFRAQREINGLLAQDPLDNDAVLQAFAQLRQINLRYQEMSHEQTVAVISQLEPEQRVRALRFMSGRRNPMEGGFRRNEGDRHDRSQSVDQVPDAP